MNVQWCYGTSVPVGLPFAKFPQAHFKGLPRPADLAPDVLPRCVPWGILIVDQQRTILFANPRARSFLAAMGGLEDRGGKIHVERANVDRSLGALIRRAAASALDTSDEMIGVPDRQGKTRFAIKVMRCSTDHGEPAALLVVSDFCSATHVSRAAVASLFRLSDREAEFAELFASGLRTDAIALQMGIAVNTARVHLRKVFAKTGCASQIELSRTFAQIP